MTVKLTFDASPEDMAIFLEEADEQIALLDSAVLALERNATPELLQSIFRAAHTLKGSSASIGHTRMADLTHALEGLLDLLRKNQLVVSTPVIDALLTGLDALRTLREEAATGEATDADFQPVIDQLHAAAHATSAPAASATSASSITVDPVALQSALAGGGAAYQVTARLTDDCLFPAVRAFQLLLELPAVGVVIASSPTMKEIEAEQVGKSVIVVVVVSGADASDRLTKAATAVLDIASVVVTPYHASPAAPAPVADERRAGNDRSIGGAASREERRVVDLGPEARGASDEEKLKLAGSKIAKMSKTIRFDVEKLDELMNLVGELVIERTRLIQIASSIEEQVGESALVTDLREASVRMGRITDELQQKTMSARMVPIENVFSRFPRMIRDLAMKNNKAVDFVIQGQETELDRSVIEQIGDPLIHLLRNAVDHGLETPEQREAVGKPRTGTIRLAAYLSESENMIVLEVEDDGRGIDAQKLRTKAVERGLLTRDQADRLSDREAVELIFAAGLSTAEKVTDVSGRGVGMDIVRANIEKLNGSIVIDTALGKGTKFTVRVPLTLAIIPVLLVLVDDIVAATPLVSVMETLRIRKEDIKTIRGQETVQLRDSVLPLVRLRHIFGLPPAESSDRAFVVAVKWGERTVGFVVDNLVGNQEIVIKPLGRLFSGVDCLSGAMILGDGRVGLILDVPGLVKRAIRQPATGRAA